ASVNAVGHTGHTLCHSCLHKLVVEGSVGILKPSVAMEQGVSTRSGLHSLVKGLEYKRIVIAIPQHKGHNAPVIEIQNSAEIDLVYFSSLIPLKLGHIGQPFFIRLFCIELAIQQVFS